MKEQVYIALGTPQKFIKLGNFCAKAHHQSINVYYNMDLGNSKTEFFDLITGTYKNMEAAHRSFHASGHSHMKEEIGGKKLFKGEICDGSPMNDLDKTLLLLGIESFYLDSAPVESDIYDPNTVFLSPPSCDDRYSILWLWASISDNKTVNPGLLFGNFFNAECTTIQRGELGDLAITLETTTLLRINGWEIRALFLKTLLPLAPHNMLLKHPKGSSLAWRSHVFVDVHLPLSAMIRNAAQTKKPIFLTEPYHIAPEAKSPIAWTKQKNT